MFCLDPVNEEGEPLLGQKVQLRQLLKSFINVKDIILQSISLSNSCNIQFQISWELKAPESTSVKTFIPAFLSRML